jgi:hypothetical protein
LIKSSILFEAEAEFEDHPAIISTKEKAEGGMPMYYAKRVYFLSAPDWRRSLSPVERM